MKDHIRESEAVNAEGTGRHVIRDAKKVVQNSEETRKFYRTVKRLVKHMAKFKEKNPPQHEIAKAKK